jgi:hypothetical protein
MREEVRVVATTTRTVVEEGAQWWLGSVSFQRR